MAVLAIACPLGTGGLRNNEAPARGGNGGATAGLS